MEHIHSNTNFTERKRGQHLSLDERGIIQALKKEGRSNHYIAILQIDWTAVYPPSAMSCGEARQRTAEKAADRNILQNVEKRHIDKIGVAAIVHILCREALISCAGWQRKFENSTGLLMYASVTHDAGNCFRKSRSPARKHSITCYGRKNSLFHFLNFLKR